MQIETKKRANWESNHFWAKDLKNKCDLIKIKFDSGIVVVYSVNDNKVSIVVSVTNNLVEKYDSVELLKKIIKFIDGKGGGGRKDLAQGGANFNLKINLVSSSSHSSLQLPRRVFQWYFIGG